MRKMNTMAGGKEEENKSVEHWIFFSRSIVYNSTTVFKLFITMYPITISQLRSHKIKW